MGYLKSDIEKVQKAADIRDFIPGIQHIGNRWYAKCPSCGADGKGGMLVTHNLKKSLAHCFKCGHSIVGAINAVMEYQGQSYPEAIKTVASQYGIEILTEKEQEQKQRGMAKSKAKGSFALKQLRESGLTVEDVTAQVLDSKGNKTWLPTFRKGSISMRTGAIDTNADEMVIFYYDLYGNQMRTPSPVSKSTLIPYVRIRWSNPLLRLDSDGRPIKYQSLKGADARFYFPQIIRAAFQSGTEIETLFIQEGEKKAEKACKHGIMSIGIQGIYNIGSKESGLIQDLQYLVKKCRIRNVVLLFDSDWDALHSSLSPGDNIDQRPNQFAKAAIKFKKYVETLHTVDLSVDVWFGHINKNENGEKGIDDLLCGSLKGKEDTLAGEIRDTMFSHDGKGKNIDIHKISSLTDYQIMDFWKLGNRDEFFSKYKDQIEPLSTFRFGKIIYRRNEDGEIIKSTTLGTDIEFWSAYKNDKDKKIIEFNHIQAFAFLEANGFYRIHSKEFGDKIFDFIKMEQGIVRSIGTHIIRDFAYRYAMQNCKDPDIKNYLAAGLGSLLGNDRLERLQMIEDDFELYEPDVQNRFYSNGQLRITAHSIEFGPMMAMVWDSKVIRRKFKRIPIFSQINRSSDGTFSYSLTKEGENCEFLQFIIHTCDFWKGQDLDTQKAADLALHLINKLTAIGYLSTDYKYSSEKKSVVAMDGSMTEVGSSKGGSGKSLIGVALQHVMEQEFIDGRQLKNDDEFMFGEVTLRTRNVFIDDVRVNFNFGNLYSAVTGPMKVNPKQLTRFTIPFEKSPKIYITTNHAINSEGPSTDRRISYMSFSDWYSKAYTPQNDFGHDFFEDWDENQWSLFDNLMAECIMIYLRSRNEGWSAPGCGIVDPPMNDINARQLRQRMGEAFLMWAESAFDKSGSYLNRRVNRKEMYDNFLEQFPGQRQFISTTSFRDRLLAYCEFKTLHFNPHKTNEKGQNFASWMRSDPGKPFKGARDSSGGNDYFTVADTEYAKLSVI